MSPAMIWMASVPVAILSFLLTGCVRKYAMRQGMLDLPNDRSSHESPTVRGGGLGFVAVVIGYVSVLSACGIVSYRTGAAYIGGGFLIALTGWIDDRKSLPVLVRLVAHCGAAIWTVTWLGGVRTIDCGRVVVEAGWLTNLLGVLVVMWLINLYNFMDGIDGLAAVEAVTVSGPFAAMLWLRGATETFPVALSLMAGVIGFLFWNWPPAKIFMGDVGSGFLGFSFGVIVLVETGQTPPYTWSLLILLGVFVMDSSVTLLRRIITGQSWYKAHRTHAYQHAARRWGHLRVTMYCAAINLVVLLPAAYVATQNAPLGCLLILSIYCTLGIIMLVMDSGAMES